MDSRQSYILCAVVAFCVTCFALTRVWRYFRLVFGARNYCKRVPADPSCSAKISLQKTLQQVASVDAAIKEFPAKARSYAPDVLPPRVNHATPDCLLKAISDWFDKCVKDDLLRTWKDAKFYSARVVADVGLGALLKSALEHLKDDPSAIFPLTLDAAHKIILEGPDGAAEAITNHIQAVLEATVPDSAAVGIESAQVFAGSLTGLDVGPMPFPFVTFSISTYRSIKAINKGYATIGDGLKNTSLDVAGTGGGAMLGIALGSPFGPPGILLGSIVGGILGRLFTNEIKYEALHIARRSYETERDDAKQKSKAP